MLCLCFSFDGDISTQSPVNTNSPRPASEKIKSVNASQSPNVPPVPRQAAKQNTDVNANLHLTACGRSGEDDEFIDKSKLTGM